MKRWKARVQNVNKNSNASDLKITDLRIATLRGARMTDPFIRIDTNQGIYVRASTDFARCAPARVAVTR